MPLTWIDTHVHVSRISPDGSPRPDLLADVLAVLDADPADLRLVISPDSADLARIIHEPDGQLHGARFIHDLVQQAPDRLYGACCINPHYPDQALQAMDLCFGEWGFPLFGEMLQYMMDYRMNSPEVERLVRRAAEFDVPVQVHISTSNSAQGPFASGNEELADLCDLVDRVPEAKYILAHFVGTDKLPPVVDGYLDDLERRYGVFRRICGPRSVTSAPPVSPAPCSASRTTGCWPAPTGSPAPGRRSRPTECSSRPPVPPITPTSPLSQPWRSCCSSMAPMKRLSQ